ncbi:hypothetical protein V1291_004859 [Nitrobacteraceae bacterium AZCC 1564]
MRFHQLGRPMMLRWRKGSTSFALSDYDAGIAASLAREWTHAARLLGQHGGEETVCRRARLIQDLMQNGRPDDQRRRHCDRLGPHSA